MNRKVSSQVSALIVAVSAFGASLTANAALNWTTFTDTDGSLTDNQITVPYSGSLPVENISSASFSAVGTDTVTGSADVLLNGTGSGAYMQFTLQATSGGSQVSSVGYSYSNRSADHPSQLSWAYSVDGGAPVNFATSPLSGASGTQSLNFSPLSVAGGQTLNIIGSFGNWSSSSPLFFDNMSVEVSAVPEPANVALGIFGGLGICIAAGKRIRASLRK